MQELSPKWLFLENAAMMVPADQMANPFQHTSLTTEELLMREAIQNSVDERKKDAKGAVKFVVRRKHYFGVDKRTIVEKFDLKSIYQRTKLFPKKYNWLQTEQTCLVHLDNPDVPLPLLILSDHNTNGLGGNWKKSEGNESKFHNLVLSLYNSEKQETSSDFLGSYGVGKMVYALASNIRTIAYYSHFEPSTASNSVNSRFMSTAFFPKHTMNGKDYSGHAFFGTDTGETNYPSKPLENNAADEFIENIGLEKRTKNDFGLTAILLDCDLSPEVCQDACEKFWWPRRFDQHSTDYVELEFFDGERKLQSKDPRNNPEIKPFVDCYSNIKHNTDPAQYERKKIKAKGVNVGTLCLKALSETEDKCYETKNSVALIRNGLVIAFNHDYKYQDETEKENEISTVGVFEASDHAVMDFTLSEPEAHDKWDFNNLRLARHLGKDAKDRVRITHERIKYLFRDFYHSQNNKKRKVNSSGLNFLDDLLGGFFKKRKTGSPAPPKSNPRAFSIQKIGWRSQEENSASDCLDFSVSLVEEVDIAEVNCIVTVTLKVLEDAEGKPGDLIPYKLYDSEGRTLIAESNKFEIELKKSEIQEYHVEAKVNPNWRTRWSISINKNSE